MAKNRHARLGLCLHQRRCQVTMRLAHNTQTYDGIGQQQVVLPAMWGPAAGAKSQISPGASALTAPHQQFCEFVHGEPAC
jgi:hypothetical protein